MPIALSTATATVSFGSTSDGTLNSDKTGFVDMPEVSGYYVIFDKSTVLDKNVDSNGIKISGRGGLAYEGVKYFQPNYNNSKTHVILPITTSQPGQVSVVTLLCMSVVFNL
jgi:hypothetical protein